MPTKLKRLLLFTIVVAFLAGMVFMGGCDFPGNFLPAKQGNQVGEPVNADPLPGTAPDAVADVVSSTSQAVVKISTRMVNGEAGDPLFNDPFFRQFFGVPYRPQQQEEGLGSGFIMSKDGFILTNEHVIDGANDIAVTVTGYDQPLAANVVGSDYNLDLALLKINADSDLPFLNMGNSDQVRVGNWVIAIGNPYGLDHTVTTGVISAKGRPINVGDRQYENLLQTDASINPGNSGGPLLNLRGEVIGINTAISAQAQGIGFAIPTSTVQRVLEELKNSENSAGPWVGVQVRPVDEEAARYLGLAEAEGALVTGVIAGSPAQKAGLKQWDVIVEFNEVKINNADELVTAIKATQVGNKVKVLLVRNRQLNSVNISIAEKPRNIK
ncbi:trypsin-like peptidase domain-containing protein [Pelotomaculum terephthalicicum JT]|uniref:S1C family serine protease n=1 Tax=Pelotomaculum TaxID=191373 RepID=UPI0009C51058|nr:MULTISPECIES: trypsin-like peptidase domain-containing protein [Pelotomaculum]MCG9968097.1 trypsin-like peptidase domain-containing protein [Pelotomaculum terephthalicicum JT]OPX85605.1 MAG: putative serine protease HhoB precursor [Pelotomaculum sp. PtaB.Bin117]OPY64024.1 MAG: putative serine protease HhoB precursor [Pelotomaculum sp. PtaU1.Bin065]